MWLMPIPSLFQNRKVILPFNFHIRDVPVFAFCIIALEKEVMPAFLIGENMGWLLSPITKAPGAQNPFDS